MHFLAPQFFHFAWLALIPLALYLFRRQAKRVPVSTLLFFRSLAREHQESAWLRKVKRWLSLALTLAVLLLCIFALARPNRDATGSAPGSVVCLLDVSASMAATDAKSQTRLTLAKQALLGKLRSLPDSVSVSLIAFADKPQVLLSRSRNRREFARLLDTVSVIPAEGKADAAMAAAKRLAALDKPSQIWHAGDASVKGELASDPSYQFLDVALESVVNVGITGFQMRKAPLARDRYEGFVRVSAAADNPSVVKTTLEARVGGRVVQLRELELGPGASASLILPLDGVRGQRLELQLSTPGDALGWDDAVIAPLPALRPLLVAWVAEKPDPFTELALAALVDAGRLEIWKGDAKNWPLKDKPDVYVFENWVPDAWPTDRPVLALTPPKSSGPLSVRALPGQGVPYDAVRSVAAEHPVLYGVNPARVAITQTAILELGLALETLWMAGNEPVLAAGEANGQRVVVSVCSPSRSEQLALLPTYPLLLGNALYWCAEGSDALSELRPQRTGDLLSLGEKTSVLKWIAWDGHSVVEQRDEVSGSLAQLQHIGAYELPDGRSGSCVLASSLETDVPKRDITAPNAKPLPGSAVLAQRMSWSQLLLWLALGVLVLESFLFHRRAVY